MILVLGVGQWSFSLEYIKMCVGDIQAELFENSRKAQILISPEGGLRFLPASSLLTSLSPDIPLLHATDCGPDRLDTQGRL